MKRVINRLNKLYDQATPEQREHGEKWYAEANRRAQLLSDKYSVPLFKVVGVISALSPNNKWERNMIDAELFLENPSLTTKVCTFFGQRHKALDILNHAETYEQVVEILGGEKTCSFYRNIMAPSWSMSVTVDLWMYRAAKLKHSAKNYKLISEATKVAAQQKGIQPHQYQAIVWSVIRK